MPGRGPTFLFIVTELLYSPRFGSLGTNNSLKVYKIPGCSSDVGITKSVLKTIVGMNGAIINETKDKASELRSEEGTSSSVHVATPKLEATTEAGSLTTLSLSRPSVTSSTTIKGAADSTSMTSTDMASERMSPTIRDVTVSVTRR